MSKKIPRLAPVVLFTYARLEHTRQTIEALKKNIFSSESDLIIFSDGPKKNDESVQKVHAVREYLGTITGFRSISIIERPENFGLAKSIISGVTEVLQTYDRIIVLEDDLVTSPYFLTYMNDALEWYAEDERVISIHGYMYPIKESLPETFFLRGADCWGWATWRRGWKLFNPNGRALLKELKEKKLVKDFDYNGAINYTKMLADQIKGKNDSWAIRWHASTFLANKLTLYPGLSLVKNIGHDGSGVHCGESGNFEVELKQDRVVLSDIDVVPSQIARIALETYFKKTKSSRINSFLNRVRRVLYDGQKNCKHA